LETTKVLKFPKNLVISKKRSTFARFLSEENRNHERGKRTNIESSHRTNATSGHS
jgi:hypothetical protein